MRPQQFLCVLTVISFTLAGCSNHPRTATDEQISVQIGKNWRLQRDAVANQIRLERRVPFWTVSSDLLAFHSHPSCLTGEQITQYEQNFIAPLKKRGASIHQFTLQTGAGEMRCNSGLYPKTENLQTEFLMCYRPEVNLLYAGDSSHEDEVRDMVRTTHGDKPCSPARK
jgi:hypothetical protein